MAEYEFHLFQTKQGEVRNLQFAKIKGRRKFLAGVRNGLGDLFKVGSKKAEENPDGLAVNAAFQQEER